MSLLPHQNRVINEKAELDYKIINLERAWDEAVLRSLPEKEHSRLTRQLEVMREYSEILGERINAFPKE